MVSPHWGAERRVISPGGESKTKTKTPTFNLACSQCTCASRYSTQRTRWTRSVVKPIAFDWNWCRRWSAEDAVWGLTDWLTFGASWADCSSWCWDCDAVFRNRIIWILGSWWNKHSWVGYLSEMQLFTEAMISEMKFHLSILDLVPIFNSARSTEKTMI